MSTPSGADAPTSSRAAQGEERSAGRGDDPSAAWLADGGTLCWIEQQVKKINIIKPALPLFVNVAAPGCSRAKRCVLKHTVAEIKTAVFTLWHKLSTDYFTSNNLMISVFSKLERSIFIF